jgi:hypothetical protein
MEDGEVGIEDGKQDNEEEADPSASEWIDDYRRAHIC